jgi:hypothetical protein
MVTMHETTNITTLGLTEDDNRIFQTIMKIVAGVHKNFNLLKANELADADMVIVNEGDANRF